MAYFKPYVDDAGLHVPTYTDIRDHIISRMKEIYGEDLYLGNDAQDYQMLSVFSLHMYDTIQLLQIAYNNHSPKTSVGTGLSSIVKINGIKRKEATHSTCVLTLKGMPGTVIPSGIVEDSRRNKWVLPENLTFERETMDVSARCQVLGAIEAPVGTITKISNPQYGWIAVTNKVPAVKGRPVETDEDLRLRQSISTAIPSQSMINSTIAGIASIHGVTRYKVYENYTNKTDENGIPGHSIAAVVEGGLDHDIAEQIYLRKGPGCGTFGTMTMSYRNSDGLLNDIHFFRPSYRRVNVSVEIKRSSNYTPEIAEQIKNNIKAYIKALDIGVPVTTTGLLTAITAVIVRVSMPTFLLTTLKLGIEGDVLNTTDIAVAFNAVADVGTVDVVVH